MKYGRSLQELAIELDRQAKVKKDYVATAGAMQMTAVNENFDLVIGNTPFQLNENAHRQLGLQLKIPAPYYERMRAENPGLLMANVNGWFQQSPDTRRMVRTLDGTARAILSDRYRRIDNYEVAQTVLPIISEMQGARIESCELTDTRMYIKVVNERIQTEVVPGDIVQAGILISNSEVGMGSVSVKPLIYRLVCTNGMVADVGVGKRHVGRINESVDGDFGIFRDETIEADDRAFLMKIEDTVRAAVDEARFNALVQKLRDAKEAPILPAAAPKVVELALKRILTAGVGLRLYLRTYRTYRYDLNIGHGAMVNVVRWLPPISQDRSSRADFKIGHGGFTEADFYPPIVGKDRLFESRFETSRGTYLPPVIEGVYPDTVQTATIAHEGVRGAVYHTHLKPRRID